MNPHDLTLSRTIPAPAEAVFDAWMDPKNPGAFWSASERLILNPIEDGLFYIVFEHEGRLWPHYGRFVRIDRPRRIEHTWVSEGTHGLESLVTFSLEPRDGQTLVSLRHSGLPDADAAREHEKGWSSMIAALGEQFSLSKVAARSTR